MFRRLMALLIACVVVLTGFTAPAYADSNNVGGISIGAKQNTDSHDTIIINPPFPEPPSTSNLKIFLNNLVEGAEGTAGAIIGGAVICYAIDSAATTVFPPAAVLLPYCPGVGAALGGRNVLKSGAHTLTQAL